MVKGTDFKSVPGVPACCRRETLYKVSLRDVFSLDSRLRGNDEGLCVQMGPGRTMRTIDLFPVTTEMGYPARTMMQRRERAAGPV